MPATPPSHFSDIFDLALLQVLNRGLGAFISSPVRGQNEMSSSAWSICVGGLVLLAMVEYSILISVWNQLEYSVMADVELSQGRSPRYPRFPLMAAVSYAKRLYDGAHRSSLDTLTAYKVMGFAGKSGASATALGAAKQYGLLENTKQGVRLSDLGLRILQPGSNEEYVHALHEAANSPPVFAQIAEQFNELPRSDEPIRSYLIRTLDFSKSGADDCIASLRETFQNLPELELDSNHRSISEAGEPSPAIMAQSASGGHPIASGVTDQNHFRILLTRDCSADLSFSGPLSAIAFERLIKHIELMKEVWVMDV